MSYMELLLGDPAPGIRVEKFLKGEPFADIAPGIVHVIEFWATWCGPCKASIPHLTALQTRHPDIPVLGVAVTWKDLGELESFLHDQGEAIGYRIAADAAPAPGARRGWMHGAWCEAAYQPGIPAAFVVDREGRIAWIGHPMEIDAPLASIVDGTWDLPARVTEYRDRLDREKVREGRAMASAVKACLAEDDRPGAIAVYDAYFSEHPELQRKDGCSKLKLMVREGDAASADYAKHLCEHAVRDDINGCFVIGRIMVERAESPETETCASRAAALVALRALELAEDLLGSDMQPAHVVLLSQHMARALLALGRNDAAADRVDKARAAAIASGSSDDTLSDLASLAARCGSQAEPTRPEASAVICIGDSCRVGEG